MNNDNPLFAQVRARHALRTAGFDNPAVLERASSTRNDVFMSSDLVVRVNRQPNQRLRREAMLCRYLPDEPWAPRVLAYGGEVGTDYLILERRPGAPLSRWWPSMSTALRRRAIEQLSVALRSLHETPTPIQVPRVDQAPHLIDPRSVTPLVPLLLALDELGPHDRSLFAALADLVTGVGDALADYSQRFLIHGDLSFENLLWDGANLTAILDFEWCRGAPLDLELDVLLRFCAFPQAHVAPDYEARTRTQDYADVPMWLAEFRPDLFEQPRLVDRLLLYAVAFSVQELRAFPEALATPPSVRGATHPMTRLRHLADDGGHIRPMLDRIGLPASAVPS